MPTFSSSINKSANKRVALKAPPRRTIRNAATQNAGLRGNDTALQDQSYPLAPDDQSAPAIVPSVVPTQELHHGEGSDSGTRRDIHSAKTGFSENHAQLDAISATEPAPRALKAPTLISTPSQERPSPSDTELRAVRATTTEVSERLELAQTSVQLGPNTRSLEGRRSRTDIIVGTLSNVDDVVTSTTDVARRVPKRRRIANQEAHPAAIVESALVGIDGDAVNPALGQDALSVSNIEASAKKNVQRKPRKSSTANDREDPRPQSHKDHVLRLANPVSSAATFSRNRKQKKSTQEVADEVIAEATSGNNGHGPQSGGRKRKCRLGSVMAENHEIAPEEIKMADLVKDQGLGKTSRREAEMAKIDWAEVKRKRRKAEEEAIQEEQRLREARKNGRPLPAPGPHVAERLVLVNGQMVIDESSRVIDRNAATARDADELGEAINEDHLTKRVNQATVGRKPGTGRSYSTWDDEETEQFYQGLRMFGTDFMMISKIFPGTSRSVIKKKYNKEEKLNPERVFAALNSKEPIDLQAFSKMTDTVYEDPKEFYKELEEEQARLEAEDARMRAQEARAEQEIHESIEGVEDEVSEGVSTQGEPQAKKNRFAAEARAIVDGIGKCKKKGKKTPSIKRKEGKRGKVLPAEGTEEIVGRIEDVAP